MAYVNVCILRHLKEELAWAIDTQLQVNSSDGSHVTILHIFFS